MGGEEAWPPLRPAMFMEMQVNREQYLHLYLSAKTLDNVMFRFGSHIKGPAPFIHWLEASLGLYSAATFFNIVIAYYNPTNSNPYYNCLVLPLRRTAGVHGINRNHYIQLLMNNDSSPLPPSSNHGEKQLTINTELYLLCT